jgi:hypothetical protein
VVVDQPVVDQPVVVLEGGLAGQGQELVGHQGGLDQQDLLPRTSDLDLEFDPVDCDPPHPSGTPLSRLASIGTAIGVPPGGRGGHGVGQTGSG